MDVDALLLQDARMIVRDFVKMEPGECVTIFTDHRRRAEAEALVIASEEAGADPILVEIGWQVSQLLRGEEFFVPPPPHVLGAMKGSNVGIFTVDETYAFRLDHKIYQLVETSSERSFFSIDPGMGTWGFSKRDRELVEERGQRLLEAMASADAVRVTTAKGTDLKLSLAGRSCLHVTPVPWRGLASVYPVPLWGELNWAPIEHLTEGTVIVDGLTEATEELRDVAAPVTFAVRQGRVVESEGGADAEAFRAVCAIDDGAAIVGELGIGVNHKAIPGTQSEKALLGAIHLGLGENKMYPGGINRSLVHVDAGVRDATIEVDGRIVMDAGRVVV